MKLPSFKSLKREDFPTAPQWVVGMFYILNNFMGSVTQALSRGISFRDNIDCQIFSYTFNQGTSFIPIDVATTISRRADGVLILQCFNETTRSSIMTNLTWEPSNQGVKITSMDNLISGNKYTIRVLII